MDKIAVIMATYNGEKFLKEQIDSILNNTYQDFTIYVCDDGSKDHTLDIAEEYARKYPSRVYACPNEKNLGVKKNFLCAAKRIEAEYYMFSDQDDVWNRDKLALTLACMQQSEKELPGKPIAVFGDAQVVDAELKEISPSFHKHDNLDCTRLSLKDIMMENKLIGCTIMFNRALRDRITEMPDEMRMHDWWIALIAAAFGKISYVNQPLLKYRQHGNNTLGSVSEIQYILQNIHDLKKQQEMLYAICRQSGAFLKVYEKDLSEDQKKLLALFSVVPEKNWFERRYIVFHNGFLKTGLLRNFGNFVIL